MPDSDNKQKGIIHILKAQLIVKGELSEEGYRALLARHYDVESSKDLSYEQATQFINDLKAMGGKIVPKRPARKNLPPTVTELPSPEILRHIEHLKNDIHWFVHDRGSKFIKKFLKKDRPTTMKEAIKLVEVLKSLKARQQKDAAFDAAPPPMRDGYVRGKGRIAW